MQQFICFTRDDDVMLYDSFFWKELAVSKEPLTVGRTTPRADALAKVTGQERYAADYYPANLLWCGVKRPLTPMP